LKIGVFHPGIVAAFGICLQTSVGRQAIRTALGGIFDDPGNTVKVLMKVCEVTLFYGFKGPSCCIIQVIFC
jgi:hypothetical protein